MLTASNIQSEIRSALSSHPWRDQVFVMDSVDSTNNALKEMAKNGAPQGTCLVALEQTVGRGRQGKSFSSPRGQGLYFSVLLRPRCIPAQVGHVTAMAAVATADAVEAVTGVKPGIKWTNDLVFGNKKLSGILSEMEADWENNTIEYIIIGVGINLSQKPHEFPEDLQNIATSIRAYTRKEPSLALLAAALVERFSQMSGSLLTEKGLWLQRYRENCVTIGKEVKVIRGEETKFAWALDIDEAGGLKVRFPGGKFDTIYSGEVSVRGLWGYI